MTDRELLELAAKAAGIKVPTKKDAPWEGIDERGIYRDISLGGDGTRYSYWNPLTDDGDALRLAVRLQFDVCQQIQTNDPVTPAGCVVVAPGGHTCFEPNNADPYAATRRAIVRAAAEIGRQA
jgi:hypothetical protein